MPFVKSMDGLMLNFCLTKKNIHGTKISLKSIFTGVLIVKVLIFKMSKSHKI